MTAMTTASPRPVRAKAGGRSGRNAAGADPESKDGLRKSDSKTANAARRFYIEDSQGNRFTPQGLAQTNPYAYQGGPVPPQNCMPRTGSLAQLGPASGALLLFELPLANTENRPLTLHIEGPFNGQTGKPEEATVTLDI